MAEPQNRTTATMRLDRLLVEKTFFPSREKAAYAIRAGGVQVNGRTVTKPAAPVNFDAQVFVDTQSTLRIGRGEHKLAGVLEEFGIDCAGKIALDVGSGAGGFTWQLLQQGAKRVYAVDVGANQLHHELRADPRVAAYEQTDVRGLTAFSEPPHVAAVDVSFISLRLILPHVCTLTRADADIVVLLKPQFEVATIELTKGGSIHNRETQRAIRHAFVDWCAANDLVVKGEVESPIRGKHGTREFFLHLNHASVASFFPAKESGRERQSRPLA
ncbi:MAG: TlyA family RNA methyltransferase [Chloroflexi bacterium]|nr:TlyA family RNA methyltransferase [Chloroflexota bacterium]